MSPTKPTRFTDPARRAAVSAPTGGHLPPQALDLEAAVLGAALLEAHAQRTLLALLPTKEVFYSSAHQQVYLAIRDLVQQGDHADLLTVVAQLRHRGTLERTGGPAFVAGLTSKINSAAHFETHCRILQEQHARRVVIRAGTELAAHGYDDTRDPLTLLADAQAHLTGLHRTLETRPGQTAAAAFDATFDRLAQAVQQQGLTGIPTGLIQLDGLTGGWQPGDLVILAARPAMGKTAALLHFARTASLDHGHNTAVFSLEMPTLQLMQRMVASEVPGYSNSDLRRGNLPGGLEQVAHIRQQAQRLQTHGHQLHIDDTPGLSIQQLRAKCARLHAQHPLSLVLVDYIQLMRGDTKGNREQEVGSISRSLKELAKELNAPVIALSQLSRDVEKRGGEKRPLLSDLRESGSLEQDADCIIFLWRGEYYKIAEYEDGTTTADTILFDIAKHRNGATDEVIAACSMRRGVFSDLVTTSPKG
ncbi:replicative DNA helicase [Hymenobacter daecheongensis DSM 21074]|uniref:Replicative DNA helicase n=1 Tax=Hymenobacter daecheongensis DSM 21074 TaxID=1121955 RepID=A0A1M6J1S3_9BACT|nr:replicative DNA helicase [Hymenobacter daecheongensis]SHJ40670.1 replicative DNA helicase [Hymenobacter daecheongensis DSM 21074]